MPRFRAGALATSPAAGRAPPLVVFSFFAVLFTKAIPPELFDMIVMTYGYEWRTLSYTLFMHEDYPPFDFKSAASDNGLDPHTTVSIAYPAGLDRWAPIYKWLLAVPHYVVLMALAIAAAVAIVRVSRSPVQG